MRHNHETNDAQKSIYLNEDPIATMTPMARDFGKLLEGIPCGAWVAISECEDKVLGYAAEIKDAIEEAHAQGEPNPIIMRAPQSPAAFAF